MATPETGMFLSFRFLWWVIPIRWIIWFLSIFASVIGSLEVADDYLSISLSSSSFHRTIIAIFAAGFGVAFLTKEKIFNVHKNMKRVDLLGNELSKLRSLLNREQLEAIEAVESSTKELVKLGVSLSPRYEIKLGDMAKLACRFDDANNYYSAAAEECAETNDSEGEMEALFKLGAVNIELGQLRLAVRYLRKASELATTATNQSLVSKCINKLGHIASLRGDSDEAHRLWLQSLAIAESCEDFSAQAAPINNLAGYKEDLDARTEMYSKSIELERLANNPQGESVSILNLGIVAKKQGEQERAKSLFLDAKRISVSIGDQVMEAEARMRLAGLVEDTSLQKANEGYMTALELMRATGYRYGIIRVLDEIAIIHKKRGELNEALEKYNNALEVSIGVGLKPWEARLLSAIGDIHGRLGDYESEKRYIIQSKNIYDDLGMEINVANRLRDLANIELLRGNVTEAEEQYETCLTMFQKLENVNSVAVVLEDLAHCARAKESYDKAKEFFLKSIDLHEKVGNTTGQARVFSHLAEEAKRDSNYEVASDYFSKSMKIRMASDDLRAIAKIKNQLGNLAEKQNKEEEAVVLYNESLQIYRDIEYKSGEADCLIALGYLERKRKKFDDAEFFISQGLKLKEEIGAWIGVISAKLALGAVADSKGELRRAETLFRQGLDLAVDVGSKSAEKTMRGLVEDIAQKRRRSKEKENSIQTERGLMNAGLNFESEEE